MAYLPATHLELAVDGHFHVYPGHSLEALASACIDALTCGAAETQPAALLAEAAGCDFFRRARRGEVAAIGACVTAPGPDEDTLWLRIDGRSKALLLFAGRQIVTRERLEIMALTRDVDIRDGLPAEETFELARDAGAFPCIAWAPGKWWGARGRTVAALLNDRSKFPAVGDSALRPRLWREPALMRMAAARGLPVLAGSDPLPFAGDERRAGQYGFRIRLEGFDSRRPADALRAAFARGNTVIRRTGKRCGMIEWLYGRRQHRRYRNTAKTLS